MIKVRRLFESGAYFNNGENTEGNRERTQELVVVLFVKQYGFGFHISLYQAP